MSQKIASHRVIQFHLPVQYSSGLAASSRRGRQGLGAGGAEGGTYRGHDEALAGAIASAWLALPDDVREKGWPTFARDGEPLEPLAS